MTVDVRVLRKDEADVLANVAPDVFDNAIDARSTSAFFSDPRHHLAVAIDDGVVVGMASAVDYVHPDKPRDLWINEVGVAPSHHRQGIGRRLLDVLLAHGKEIGCREAWVLTSPTNDAALKLYGAAGGVRFEEDSAMFTFQLR